MLFNHFVFVYLDYILILKLMHQHIYHIHSILKQLLENLLVVKAGKCEFHASVSFLGYGVAQRSIKMDPAKVTAVTMWPVWDSRKQLHFFLGLANFYQHFIRNYTLVAAPPDCLNQL